MTHLGLEVVFFKKAAYLSGIGYPWVRCLLGRVPKGIWGRISKGIGVPSKGRVSRGSVPKGRVSGSIEAGSTHLTGRVSCCKLFCHRLLSNAHVTKRNIAEAVTTMMSSGL